MQTAVVTGGSGFIGTHLVEALRGAGWAVTNFDIAAPRRGPESADWVQADLNRPEPIADLVGRLRPDALINLAAVATLDSSGDALKVNVDGLRYILDAVRTASPETHIVHTSTQLVVEPGYDAKTDIDHAPYTAYGESKARSELVLHEEAGDLVWTTIRPTTIWGAYHPGFPSGIWKYLEKGFYLQPSGPAPLRSYGYVGNVAEQIIALLAAPRDRVQGRTFYVGDAPVPSSDWIDAFSLALRGTPARRVPIGALKALARIGDVAQKLHLPAPIESGRYYRMTTPYPVPMGPTFEVLGHGSTNLEHGVEETVRWLRSTHQG